MSELSLKDMEKLLDVGIALSNTRSLPALLDMILAEVRGFTTADAGTLYLVKGDELYAEIAQNQTFVNRLGQTRAQELFSAFCIPIDMNSIAGAAVVTKQCVNIPDVQTLDATSSFHYDPSFDEKYDYSTHSNLAVPMINFEGEVVGVLQLINATRDGKIQEFSSTHIKLATALSSQAGVAIQNVSLTENLQQAHLDSLRRLGVAAEWRDKETANHITRVSYYSRIIADYLGWDSNYLDLITHASPMHDVGKLGIPDAILHKPGRFDDDEREIMETHCVIGSKILSGGESPVMQMSREIILGHHEKWDGTGYPLKISGDDIPLSARIVALADVYDALSSRRCYKPAFDDEKVMAIINEEKGKHFDPMIVDALMQGLSPMHVIRDRYADTDEDFENFRDYKSLKP